MTDPPFPRLLLQLERDLLVQAQLRVLLTAADATVAADRQDLRNVKRAHAARQSARPGHSK